MKDKYYKFLKGLRLRHFSPEEIIAQSERVKDDVTNTLPPPNLWHAIVPTLWVADQLRRHLGYPLIITSAYRSKEYNKKCGGAVHSQHKNNTALDLIPRVTPTEAFNALKKMRDAGTFRGGLGLYKSFVHIDTRGRNATWG